MKALFGNDNLWVQVDVKDYEVNVKQIKDAIAGLKLLGKEVNRIELPLCCFCDIDTPYYKRLPEDVTDIIFRRLSGRGSVPVATLKGNLLYMEVEGIEIVLPKYMQDGGGSKYLTVALFWKN